MLLVCSHEKNAGVWPAYFSKILKEFVKFEEFWARKYFWGSRKRKKGAFEKSKMIF